MKLTKSKLVEMIKQELKEFTTSAGGTVATKARTSAEKGVSTKKADKASKKKDYDTKSKTVTTKSDAYTKSKSDYDTKKKASDDKAKAEPAKYSWTVKGQKGIQTGAKPPKGAANVKTQPAWTTWDKDNKAKKADADTAEKDKNTKDTEKRTADREKETSKAAYDSAVDAMDAAERKAKAYGEKTSFAVSAGGGGRAGGAAGTAKKGGGKKGKGKGREDESLFRILGRELIREINDTKKYLKNQKFLHKK